jgi:uncharacterized protein
MKWVYVLLLFMNAIIVGGCSGTMFSSYPGKINPMIAGLQRGTPLNLEQCLVDECKGSDRILYNMERGRVAHILGNIDVSMRDFSFSIASIKVDDEKAIISASGIAENFGAVLINDNAISYTGEGYERVMLYHYQALNFLKKKDLEGAGVEVRRANSEQEDALKRFETEVEDARRAAAIKQINRNSQSAVTSQYAQLDEVAGRVKNSFQNAYTFYVSGFIYELLNQTNDAYIDYKKALEIYPENRYLQKDVIRLAAALNMGEDLDALRERFGIESLAMSSAAGDTGELLVLFEDGFAPQKQEVRITLPIPNAGLVPLAFPIYRERWAPQFPVSVSANGDLIGNTEPICDIRALAVKALKEKAPLIAIRQIIRAVAKGASAHAAKKQYGDLGAIGMSIVNIATEHADLRSWLTLPANVQILRASLPAGKHAIAIQYARGGSALTEVEIPPHGKTVLQVIKTGNRFYTYSTAFPSPLLTTTN